MDAPVYVGEENPEIIIRDGLTLSRFFNKIEGVDDTESCWLWRGAIMKNGYGSFRVSGQMRLAHRVMYRLKVGPIPDGLFVCHRCDVRNCLNPKHHFLGTAADNQADMMLKRRSVYGDDHWTHANPEKVKSGIENPNCKISPEAVSEIRELAKNGALSQREIGDRFGISQTQTSRIIRGRRWRMAV